MMTRKLIHSFIGLILSSSFINLAHAEGEGLELAWELTGLANPESVVYDPRLNLLYVSNVNGGPNDKDGNGYISLVSMDGRIINEKWVTNLNGPKGLALSGNMLYTADIDEIVTIDVDHGRILNKYKIDGAKFLNDVTATDTGDIYVSDMLTNKIHLLSGTTVTTWLESDELEFPNGLLFTEDDIILGTWGKMTDGFATEVPGHLKRISLKTKQISDIGDGSPVGNMDGVEGNDDIGFYVTDWMNGTLFHISAKGEVTTLLDLDQGSADIELVLKKHLLIIPMMNDNKMFAYKIQH